MKPWQGLLCAAPLALLASTPVAQAQESFDVSAFEKKACEWTGFLELLPEQQSLRRNSTGYRLLYPVQTLTTLDRRSEALEVSGVLRQKALSFNFTGHASSVDDTRASNSDARMYEAYAAWQFDPTSMAEIGKRALHWGKGYAWSPVAFFERPKDPTDPDLAREGFMMATGALVRSLDGPLKTVSLTAAMVPTTSDLNKDFGPSGHINPALKLYGLLFDTDVDLIFAGHGSRGQRLGADFSSNLSSSLEVHGEWARSTDAPRATLSANNALKMQTLSYDSALLGLRYLTERDTTIIFELYRNGSGYSAAEMAQFDDLVQMSAANPALLQTVARAAAQGYNRPNAMRNYAYLRVSQKEPFDILDFTPAFTVIANTGDHSYSLVPEALYTGIKNLELRLRLTLTHGEVATDYGEKPVSTRAEFRARYFF